MNVQEIFNWINGQIGFRLITPTDLMEENWKLQQAIENGFGSLYEELQKLEASAGCPTVVNAVCNYRPGSASI